MTSGTKGKEEHGKHESVDVQREQELPKKSMQTSRNALQGSYDEQAGRPGRRGYTSKASIRFKEGLTESWSKDVPT